MTTIHVPVCDEAMLKLHVATIDAAVKINVVTDKPIYFYFDGDNKLKTTAYEERGLSASEMIYELRKAHAKYKPPTPVILIPTAKAVSTVKELTKLVKEPEDIHTLVAKSMFSSTKTNRAEAMLEELNLEDKPKRSKNKPKNELPEARTPEKLTMQRRTNKMWCYKCGVDRLMRVKPFRDAETNAVMYEGQCPKCKRYSIKFVDIKTGALRVMPRKIALARHKRKRPARDYRDMVNAAMQVSMSNDNIGNIYYIVPDEGGGLYVVLRMTKDKRKPRALRGAPLDPIGYSELLHYIAYRIRGTVKSTGVVGEAEEDEDEET